MHALPRPRREDGEPNARIAADSRGFWEGLKVPIRVTKASSVTIVLDDWRGGRSRRDGEQGQHPAGRGGNSPHSTCTSRSACVSTS